MPKVLVDITSGQFKALKDLSKSTGQPVNVHIRSAIDKHINNTPLGCAIILSGGVIASGFIFQITTVGG